MSYLLKIVEGPMKGAEVALVIGTTIRIGRSSECDIVINDQTLDDVVGEFKVEDDGVTIITPDGNSEKINPFEIQTFGTTSFAIGPQDGAWQSLIAKPKVVVAPVANEEEVKEEAAPSEPTQPEESSAEATESAPEAPEVGKKHSPLRLLGCLLGLVILAFVGVLIWFFWPKIVESLPENVSSYLSGSNENNPATQVPVKTAKEELAKLAADYKLNFTAEPVMKLSGNLAKRTERLAIRSLAQAIDSRVKLDLTDDETMFKSASALLFAVTEGAITVQAVTNRALVLTGYAPNEYALTKALKALNEDVPAIESLDTKLIRMGGTPPEPVAKTTFATIPEKALKGLPLGKEPKPKENPNKRLNYPIAGVLMAPYPCVVMRNGQRLIEGAVIGTATLIKIEADKLTFKDGSTTFEWEP